MLDQRAQHRVFARRERQRFVQQAELFGGAVVAERAAGKTRVFTAPRAADQRDQARFEFAQLEGFGEEVVGPAMQAGHALHERVARGEDEHGQALVGLAQVGQHVVPAQTRQTQVEDQRVVSGGLEATPHQAAVVHPVDLEVALGKGLGEPVAQFGFVFGQQDSHGHALGWVARVSRPTAHCRAESGLPQRRELTRIPPTINTKPARW
ncbi:hypothetical protein D9M68_809760 [compost metagenome]